MLYHHSYYSAPVKISYVMKLISLIFCHLMFLSLFIRSLLQHNCSNCRIKLSFNKDQKLISHCKTLYYIMVKFFH